jgi:hypothetical protein
MIQAAESVQHSLSVIRAVDSYYGVCRVHLSSPVWGSGYQSRPVYLYIQHEF